MRRGPSLSIPRLRSGQVVARDRDPTAQAREVRSSRCSSGQKSLSDFWLTTMGIPLPCFSKVLILKGDKVLCFDTPLEVFILKVLRWHQNRAKRVLILKNL